MSPKMKTRDVKMRSCRKNKTKETAPIKSPLKMTKPKSRIMQKTSKDKKNFKSVSSASTVSCVPSEENKNAEIDEEARKCLLKAFKKYENLKKKRLNTPEKDNDPMLKESCEPGDSHNKYHDIFLSLPGFSDSDEEPEELVKTDRRGRKIAEERKNAEKERKNAERERKNAEKERKKAEKERKKAERERKKAERERKNAEKKRKKAEKEREKKRIKDYKELKKAERERKREKRRYDDMVKYCLTAYKYSPDYQDLKQKKFNTSFINEIPRRREIKIFTDEEINETKRELNWPAVTWVPGESNVKYNDIYMSLPGFYDSDEEPEEIVKTKGRRGNKNCFGYDGLPYPDDYLFTDYRKFL